MAMSKLPSTNAPRWSSAYGNRLHAARTMPVRLRKVTKVKNLRYALNQSWKRIHLLALGLSGFFAAAVRGAGGGGVTVASTDEHDSIAFFSSRWTAGGESTGRNGVLS
jgi:hypothetical protein